MAYAYVQSKHNATLSSGTSIASGAWGSNTTAGNLIVYWVQIYDPSPPQPASCTVSDGTNTYSEIRAYTPDTASRAYFGYAKNIAGGSTAQLTATFDETVGECSIFVAEYSGFDTLAPYTSGEYANSYQNPASTTTDVLDTGNTPALAAQPAGVISFMHINAGGGLTAPAAGTGFTSRATGIEYVGGIARCRLQDKRVTSTSATNATATPNTADAAFYFTSAMVFKEQEVVTVSALTLHQKQNVLLRM